MARTDRQRRFHRSSTLAPHAIRGRQLRCETLETRQLLVADLVGQWRADDFNATLDDGEPIAEWTDSVSGIPAVATGTPRLAKNALGGNSTVRFQRFDGADALGIAAANNPLAGVGDFTVVAVFATEAVTLNGGTTAWFLNTGLVDATGFFGTTADWGLVINSLGQLGAGSGNPATSVYGNELGLNDGQLHVATFTKLGDTLSLYVDNRPAATQSGAGLTPRIAVDVTFGAVSGDSFAYSGDLAEVRMYDGALSAAEVDELTLELRAHYSYVPPITADDNYTLPEDTPLVVAAEEGVLSNDRNVEPQPLTVALIDSPQHGTLALAADGSFTYQPDPQYFGPDQFTYRAMNLEPSGPVTVTLDITSVYDPAVAVADQYLIDSRRSATVDAAEGLLANDINHDDATLTAKLVADVSDGTLTLREDGSFDYDPAGFVGVAEFTYLVNDGVGDQNTARVTLLVDTPPVANDDQYELTEDVTLNVDAAAGVVVNDTDAESDTLTVSVVTLPARGDLTLLPDGSFQYDPQREYAGPDSFIYVASDGDQQSPPAAVRLNVLPVNDLPILIDDTYLTFVDELLDVQFADGVLANDRDVDGPDSLAARLVQSPQQGTLTLTADGAFTYQPQPGFIGTDRFEYLANDGVADSATATVTLIVASLDQQIVINELHTDPPDETQPAEFIELHNAGRSTVDLSGWHFTGGVEFVFPAGTLIEPQEFLVVAQDPATLQAAFGVTGLGPYVGKLANEGEQLTLNNAAGDRIDRITYRLGFPWPTVGVATAELPQGTSLQLLHPVLDNDLGGSWRSAVPTPGSPNNELTINAAPQLGPVEHSPQQPTSADAVTITIRATDQQGVAEMVLEYQDVEPGNYIGLLDEAYAAEWTAVPMFDDGNDGDLVAGDSIYTAVLPGELQQHRHLIRYRIRATDTVGVQVLVPYADDPQPNFAYFVYDGVPDWTGSLEPGVAPVVTYSSAELTRLPTYHLIASELDVLRSQYDGTYNLRQFRGTLVYDGIVYDHIEYRNRGRASTYQVGKNKWKLNFARGHAFEARDNYGNRYAVDWDKLNILPGTNPWWRNDVSTEGTVLFEPAAFKLYELAGTPASHTQYFQFRIIDSTAETSPDNQYEGDFWGLYIGIEQPDGRFLEDRGLPDGNIFNMHGGVGGSPQRSQGSALPTDGSDLGEFINGQLGYLAPSQPLSWWEENLNFESYFAWNMMNFVTSNTDIRVNENVNYYHNQENGQWYVLPWDMDLTFEDRPHLGSPIENREAFLRLMAQHPEAALQYENRVRETLDLLLDNGDAALVIDEFARVLAPQGEVGSLVEANRALWDHHPRKVKKGIWYDNFTPELLPSEDFAGLVTYMQDFVSLGGYGNNLLVARGDDTDIPATPAIDYVGPAGFAANQLTFESGPFADPQGSQTFAAMEWRVAEVHNPSVTNYDPTQPYRYEIEGGWSSGPRPAFEERFTLPVSAVDAGKTYRARVRMQDTEGHWSHWSEAVEFVAGPGSFPAAVAGLRISEVHYHPADPSPEEVAAGHTDADDFEFLEITNISTEVVELAGVELQQVTPPGESPQGVAFAFASGQVPRLRPGERLVVVENLEAFRARYSAVAAVAGQWTGGLSNNSEALTLAAGEQLVQTFTYNDNWYPTTDGRGPSLEAVDLQQADLSVWSTAAGWRRSDNESGGTPGHDPAGGILKGDFDVNGLVNAADIDRLFAEVRSGSDNAAFDLTADQRVDRLDVDRLVRGLLTTDYGDVDLDGHVTAADDGRTLLDNLGRGADLSWAEGDLNGDGRVTASGDMALLLAALGGGLSE